MRVRRLAMLSGTAAAIGGALWVRRSRQAEPAPDAVVDLGTSGNGADRDRDHQRPDALESELSG